MHWLTIETDAHELDIHCNTELVQRNLNLQDHMTLEKISVITFFFVLMPPELSKSNFLNNQYGFQPCSVHCPYPAVTPLSCWDFFVKTETCCDVKFLFAIISIYLLKYKMTSCWYSVLMCHRCATVFSNWFPHFVNNKREYWTWLILYHAEHSVDNLL